MSYTPPPPPPSGAPGYGGYAMPTTSNKAVWALVLGILSIICCGVFTGIPAIFLGLSAKKEVEASGGALTGGGMAQAGFIIGIIGCAISVLAVIVFALTGSFLGSFSTTSG